ncbi:MAG TPA: hypothetical protein VLL48_04335 [Longimicrobiales bacterium]|nr:hypothetical protein [Longimicrobiales bacterium]
MRAAESARRASPKVAARHPGPGPAGSGAEEAALRCELATAADDPALRSLLRDTAMEGWVRLAFPREPSYFGAAPLEGEHVATVVVRSRDGTVVGMGSRSLKEVWWAGEPARLGYLGQLRFATGWRAGRRTLARAYDLVRRPRGAHELPFDLTSVVADNEPARRLVERGLPGLPRYTPLAELVTVVVPTGGAGGRRSGLPFAASSGIRVERVRREGDLVSMARRLGRSARALRLAPRWSPRRLAELAEDRLGVWTPLVARDGGRVVGCAAVWDQRTLRQCVVAGYAPWIARVRPVLSTALRLTGRPGLPPAGSALRLGYLSHLAADGPGVVEALVAGARPQAARRGLEHLALAFTADRPEPDRIRRRFGGHTYRSVLYAVHDPEVDVDSPGLSGERLGVEVATL